MSHFSRIVLAEQGDELPAITLDSQADGASGDDTSVATPDAQPVGCSECNAVLGENEDDGAYVCANCERAAHLAAMMDDEGLFI